MREFNSFEYLYPLRPEIKSPASSLNKLEKQGYFAQGKFNGSCMTLSTNGKSVETWDRHKTFIQTKISNSEFAELHKNGWSVFVGEYLNKNQDDENKKKFNHKFIIFDIIVNQGEYLVGETFENRQSLLDDLLPVRPHNNLMDKFSDNIYRAKNFYSDFENIWKEITKAPLYEGLVLKKSSSRLEIGYHPNNNTKSQIKVRKEHKNYQF